MKTDDQIAFEAAMVKALPVIRGREHVYFACFDDGYVHPEASLAFLAFKLGAKHVLDRVETFVKR